MPKNKRLRVFAGPNGSGKSTLFNEFKKQYDPGYFINADKLEKQLSNNGFIDLQAIGLKVSEKELTSFSKTREAKSLLAKSIAEGHIISIEIKENCIVGNADNTHSYEASFVATFIRWLLYSQQKSFSFETVMSHPSKIKEMKQAREKVYRRYLYFVCIDDPTVNVKRVEDRVKKGGHRVDTTKIISRYPDTLKNLYLAIKYADRAYLFDNSGKQQVLIAEISEGVLQIKSDNIPNWFINYVLPHYQNQPD
jgi:predicted ABC-type ATPase